jgi:lysophospholipase
MLGLSPHICPLAAILNSDTPKYGPGQTGYSDDSTSFEGNEVTRSKVRYLRKIAAYADVPEARLGGASIQWVRRSCLQFKTIFEQIDRINTPFLLFSSENETVVHGPTHQKFMNKMRKSGNDSQAYLVNDAQHELLMEKDEQRNMVISTILQFFMAH